MEVMFIGDSLTAGFLVKRSKNWVKLIEDKTDIKTINKGINGDTSSGILSRFQKDVVDNKVKKLHLICGYNDLFCDSGFEVIKPNIMALALQSRNYGIDIVIGIPADIFPIDAPKQWQDFMNIDKIQEDIKKYNSWLRKFCKAFDFAYIDYNKELYNYYDGDIRELYLDGLHFNEKGHEIFAKIFIDNYKR